MRLPIRWCAFVAAAFFCTFLYTFRRTSSFRLQKWATQVVPGPRLVVFGDSWSDNGITPGSFKPEDNHRVSRPTAWTDGLCAMIHCEYHANYAQSTGDSWVTDGAVVDDANLNFPTRNDSAPPDLGWQIEKWISSQVEEETTLTVDEVQARIERTIFVVHIGFWDIWHASQIEDTTVGKGVIEREVDHMFHQISKLLDFWGNGTMRIIIPFAIDPTYLPSWQTRLHTGKKENGVREQRSAVSLVDVWNQRVEFNARAHELTEVYLFDTNAFMLDHIRDTQMKKNKITDHDGLGTATPQWEIVEAACIGSHDGNSTHATVEGETRCGTPEKYLFWDEMHLGAEANELMAKEISEDIAGNFADAWVKSSSWGPPRYKE